MRSLWFATDGAWLDIYRGCFYNCFMQLSCHDVEVKQTSEVFRDGEAGQKVHVGQKKEKMKETRELTSNAHGCI